MSIAKRLNKISKKLKKSTYQAHSTRKLKGYCYLHQDKDGEVSVRNSLTEEAKNVDLAYKEFMELLAKIKP